MMDAIEQKYVARIVEENEELREQVRQLQELLGLTIEVPLMLGLTGKEAALLGFLMKRDLVTKEAAMIVLYGDRLDELPEEKIIDVFVCKMRPKLAPVGIEIDTVWGRGYRMRPEMRAKLEALLAQQRGEVDGEEAESGAGSGGGSERPTAVAS